MNKLIVLVDDEILDSEIELLTSLFNEKLPQGFKLKVFNDPLTLYRFTEEKAEHVSLLISDLAMPGYDGEVLCAGIKKMNPHIHTVIISALPDEVNRLKDHPTLSGALLKTENWENTILESLKICDISANPHS